MESSFGGQAAALGSDGVGELGIGFTEDVLGHSRPEDGFRDLLLVELTGADVITKCAPFGLQRAEGFHECECEGGAKHFDFVGVDQAAEEVAVHGLAAIGRSKDDVLRATGFESAPLLPHAECVAADHVSGRSSGTQPALGGRELPAEEELEDAIGNNNNNNKLNNNNNNNITAFPVTITKKAITNIHDYK